MATDNTEINHLRELARDLQRENDVLKQRLAEYEERYGKIAQGY